MASILGRFWHKTTISMEFGLFSYLGYFQVESVNPNNESFVLASCRPYDRSIKLDSYWKAARAFSYIAFTVAFVVIILNIVSSCQVTNRYGLNQRLTHPWEPFFYLITSLFLGLCFLFFRSNACLSNSIIKQVTARSTDNESPLFSDIVFPDTCSLGQGGKFTISATVFWFVSSITSYLAYRAERQENARGENAELNEPLISNETLERQGNYLM